MENDNNSILNLGAIDFMPAWMKKDEKVVVGKYQPLREDNLAKKPERRGFKPRDEKYSAKTGGGRNDQKRGAFARPERVLPLDAEIKILPDPKALGAIIRKLQSDFHAYKLKDLAHFFLDNTSSILLKIVPRVEHKFYQCKACSFVSDRYEDVVEHLLGVHLSDYYEAKEVECEPPKGNFTSVARCGLSGVLLGPPNLHEFNSVVREMLRTRYPDMAEDEYRRHIEIVHEPEAIEEWRKLAVKRTVYVAKGVAEAHELTREQVEGEFKRLFVPTLITEEKRLMITAKMALNSPCRALVYAVRDALEADRRSPQAMCYALRGAFHNRKLNFFRTNDARGQEFVTSVTYRNFDAEHAIRELADMASFIAEHPCSSREEIAGTNEKAKHLDWLVSTGHVVAFTNGVFSAVEKYPKYGPMWRNRKKEAPETVPEAAIASEAETPANTVAEQPAL